MSGPPGCRQDGVNRVKQHRVRLGQLAATEHGEGALPQLEVAVHVSSVGKELVDLGVVVHADLGVSVMVRLLPLVSRELGQRRQTSVGQAGARVVRSVKHSLVILSRAALIIQREKGLIDGDYDGQTRKVRICIMPCLTICCTDRDVDEAHDEGGQDH